MGAPLGNRNQSKTKPWSDAIRRALARRERTGSGANLNRLAEALLDRAAEGDLVALRELGDRLDGKAAQSISAEVTTPPSTISIRNA
jgi:hypothetical protein